ncbi:endonuclease [Serratia sp. S1B]|nr:endonuclease [Serratia sp. S1B]
MSKSNNYLAIIERIFFSHYQVGMREFEFNRTEIAVMAVELGIDIPKNIGDVIYSVRYRIDLTDKISSTAEPGHEWIISGVKRAGYKFHQVKMNRVVPRDDLVTIKIPDATPEIIERYALSDEQALLAKVRYNRLIDTFLGITASSLQNHLRTTVKGVGQIEIDEIYVAVDKYGRQFVIPVQAKGGNDKHAVVQTKQDILCCAEKFPQLICKAVSAQFMENNKIAMFELVVQDDEVKIVDEKHYLLVSASSITDGDIIQYSQLAKP